MDFLTETKNSLHQLSNVEKKKHLLKKRIVRYLYFNGPKSAAEISKKLKSSIPTITTTIIELISNDVIKEQGQGNSSGGRRPNLYGLQNDTFFILGIDIGRFATKMAIFNTKLENITGLKTYPLKLENDSKQIDEIYEIADKLINKSGILREKIIGVGVDMPGLVDAENGRNYTYFYEKDRSLAACFEERFQLPVYIENDAKARTIAEYRYGLAKGVKNALIMHVGWGVDRKSVV